MFKTGRFFCWVICLAVMFVSGAKLHAQTTLVPAELYYRFYANSPNGCGGGGLAFYGYQYGGVTNYISVTSNMGSGTVSVSWTLDDDAGNLASGSGSQASFGIYLNRIPIGDLRFLASGYYQNPNGCGQSFYATSYTSIASGGESYITVDTAKTFVFQNVQSGLVISLDSSSLDDSVIESVYAGGNNQKWTLGGAGGFYQFQNNGNSEYLFSDYQSGSSLVYLTPSTGKSWRFISAGDGSYQIVYEQYQSGTSQPPVYNQYALQPTASGKNDLVEAVPRLSSASQRWYVFEAQ